MCLSASISFLYNIFGKNKNVISQISLRGFHKIYTIVLFYLLPLRISYEHSNGEKTTFRKSQLIKKFKNARNKHRVMPNQVKGF